MNRIGRLLARYLEQPLSHPPPFAVVDPATLQSCLKPADVLLVEGTSRISLAIKYLTQSTWSHAALYVGDALSRVKAGAPAGALVEADLELGVIAVPLAKYSAYNVRICRPVGLTEEDRGAVVDYVIHSLGRRYDLRNIFDLMRYLLPQPPIPVRWRRRMLALGSGDPTRAICSTLIAEAFESVRYPILPLVSSVFVADVTPGSRLISELMHIRHHSLFTPRDFDISPYFQVVKPVLGQKFDYKAMHWAEVAGDAKEPIAAKVEQDEPDSAHEPSSAPQRAPEN